MLPYSVTAAPTDAIPETYRLSVTVKNPTVDAPDTFSVVAVIPVPVTVRPLPMPTYPVRVVMPVTFKVPTVAAAPVKEPLNFPK